uniref:Uncharacterized protein n=1 Tax=Oncorhynchus tshawytscha TaxID=74940 RepID=A0A8C8MGZ7_ONCTS
MKKVILVTVVSGLALCERLLCECAGLQLCLACRNMQRADAARSALLTSHPDAHIDLLHLDIGSVRSELCAAHEVKSRYRPSDHQTIDLDRGIIHTLHPVRCDINKYFY